MRFRGSAVGLAVTLLLMASGALARQHGDPALVVRTIGVEGNETTKDYIILRELSTKVGDTLDLDRLEYDKKRVYSLGLFNRVDIDYSAKGNEANLIVRVHERWFIYPFPILGFKYRDPKKFYYGLGLAHINFRGRNEKLALSFALGFDRWVQVSYQNPKLTADDDIFFRISVLSASVENLNPDRGLYQQRNYGGVLTLGRRFGLYNLVRGNVGYEVWIVSDPASLGTISRNGRDAFLSASVNYSYDTRDVREYAGEGYYLFLTATKYGLGESNVDFLRYGYETSLFLPVPAGLSLGGRLHGQFSSGGPVPSYRYVYFGYGERIRGYFDNIFEGENIVGGNVELRIPILSVRYYEFPYSPLPEFSVWRYGLYAGMFADAGKTWFRSEGLNGRHWYSGFGAGLHFLLPYSIIIRTELAWSRRGVPQFVLDFGASF